jgi:serine/threonine-protein kinase HipA
MKKLNIYQGDVKVGTLKLDENTEQLELIYTDMWKDIGFALSPVLDFQGGFSSKSIKNFLENLLPEGEGLDVLSRYFQISKSNKFALIQSLGKETTGAFTFTISDKLPKTSFLEISKDELSAKIKNRKDEPISVWNGKPRLSVAGVQDKLPICYINGKFGFGEGALASTHILKFDKADEQLVFNEFISLKLASLSGLNVNNAELLVLADEDVLMVKRFDRIKHSDKKIERLHIIDGCQMLDYSPNNKYERNFGSGDDVKDIREGVSFKKIVTTIKSCDHPIEVKSQIIDWICTNLCLGNVDAHAKNISYMVSDSGIKLAPFYDIVNINLYHEKYEQELAMAIDDEFDINKLKSYDFIEFFKENSINKTMFLKQFVDISNSIIDSLNKPELFEFDQEKRKIVFFNKYKRNTLERIKKLKVVMHYINLPDSDKAFVKFFNKNKERIEDIIDKEFLNSHSKSSVVDKFFELTKSQI